MTDFPVRRPRNLASTLGALVGLATVACSDAGGELPGGESIGRTQQSASPPTASFPATFARQWMTNVANAIRGDVINPPLAARTYAYSAVAMYEAVVHGMPGYHSLAGQLNGLTSLPTPDPSLEYDWPTVLAQTMHRLTAPPLNVYVYPNRLFFEYTTPSQASLQSLGPTQIGFRRADGVPPEVIEDSIEFADRLAEALVQWAASDGYNQLRYAGFIPPTGPDKWVSTGFSDRDKVMLPTEPHFGEVRPMVLHSADECDPPFAVPFSTDPSSAFYAQAAAVRDVALNITAEEKEIAAFWADVPGPSATPAGHWVALTTNRVRTTNLAAAAHAYALVSMGFHDSFVAIWQTKFKYNLLRPETYIRRHIDPGWTPLWPTPQFPSWVSGHSGQSGASGVLLDSLFPGPVVDNTKLRRGLAVRNFASYAEASEEAAISRLYGGIHYPMDNNDGLTLGRCVGNAILDRVTFHL